MNSKMIEIKSWMNSKRIQTAEWNKEDNVGYERGIH
jgi:hypothetical protein